MLTENRHDDDAEIEHVPRLFEVIETQAKELHDALEREDGDEELVDKVEDDGQLRRLVVVLHRSAAP